MKLQQLAVIAFTASLFLAAPALQADELSMQEVVTADDLKPNLPQPYVVKKGDTLWDIANYFFKDPQRWIKIWERNLYITNPDLIYPGNEIWFDGRLAKQGKQGGLTKVRPQPEVVLKPVEKLEPKVDPTLFLTALRRQDFIQPDAVNGVGHILDSVDERLNYGANDRIYVKLDKPAAEGDLFDVFRTGDPVHDPKTGRLVGYLVNHLGQIEVTSQADGTYRATVLNAYEEISRGDRLKPAKKIDPRVQPNYPSGHIFGAVMYIQNDAAEAGQNQVIGINLGKKDGMTAGTALSIHRAGRLVQDAVTGKQAALPEEKIGELLVLVPQERASIALVTMSTSAINIGDSVRNQASH